ncbi:peptidoglycan-binding protein [Eggerthellaceae bacterium zg-893]|nr:peptidoglycan-binding protein [Eggerthellaceae bacterium zg-893]
METIKPNDTGAAVEDVQQRLCTVGLLDESAVTGTFDAATQDAVHAFRTQNGFEPGEEVTEKVWSALVDASYHLGDRTLYLRMPYFHGQDVLDLQHALGALGFGCGASDGIFGAFTELALRKFQMNLGLPSDGIAGAYTYAAIRNLHHSWEGKEAVPPSSHLGFARAADVLEANALCLFGTAEFTRSVASRMSNLALATNPASKIMSADSLLVAPDADMLLVHIVLPESETGAAVPRVTFEDEQSLAVRLRSAVNAAQAVRPSRVAVELPGVTWEDAGEGRSAQHYAISLLDALCAALS